MIAIDTNIIVRFIMKDDPDQFARVRALLAANPVYVCKTVVLECEWVLRSAYRLPRTEIRNALMSFAGLPGVTLEDPQTVHAALIGPLDLADALHLASRGEATRFATLDKPLIAKAAKTGIEVFEP